MFDKLVVHPKRVYVSGPMSGLPDLNFPAFAAAAARLRKQGYEVVNPAELDVGEKPDYEYCLRVDIAAMMTCGQIYMLKGWEASKGALVESRLATVLGMPFIFEGRGK